MAIALQIQDESTDGQRTIAFTLDLHTEIVTIRELIRSRVFQEVKHHNVQRNQSFFRGLVRPAGAEREANGFRLREGKQLDWREQFEVALRSFADNGFLILVDDKQAESLDEEVSIRSNTRVTFIRLVPLVGG